jgi:hypothetical protein
MNPPRYRFFLVPKKMPETRFLGETGFLNPRCQKAGFLEKPGFLIPAVLS